MIFMTTHLYSSLENTPPLPPSPGVPEGRGTLVIPHVYPCDTTCVPSSTTQTRASTTCRVAMPLLPALRDLFSGPLCGTEGPRLRVVKKQNELFKTTTPSPLLSDCGLKFKVRKFGDVPPTISIPGDALQPILMALPGRLFILKEGESYRELNDVFSQVASIREVHSAFYLAIVDCWPALQEEFVRSMAAFIKMKPQNQLRMPFDCVAEIMKAIDPSVSRRPDNGINHNVAADALCFAFHQRLKRHLRYHCAIHLMMLFSNDITINEKKIVDKETLKKTIPTLSGFAAYLDTAFGGIIRESIRAGSRNETICLFYESERAPAWNMLRDDQGTKNLQQYLDGVDRNTSMGKLICAPADLFEDEWPELSEIGSLDTYIFKGGEMIMPPIRKVAVSAWEQGHTVTVELVAEIILPMRLLLHPTFCVETTRTIWNPEFDYYTMNVTTDMLTQSSRSGEMPTDFEITDHRAFSIHADSALPQDVPLPADMFAIWADVMLCHSATIGGTDAFRRRMEKLPLLRNFVMVRNDIKVILSDLFECNRYIEDRFEYNNSPIQNDWATTSWEAPSQDDWQIRLDPDFRTQFEERSDPPARNSWATSSFFDMSLGFLKTDPGFQLDPTILLTNTNIRGTIWEDRLEAEDIAPLMSKLDLWSRHQFAAAELVVAAQHRNHSKADEPPMAQVDPQHPQRRPRVMLSNSSNKRRFSSDS